MELSLIEEKWLDLALSKEQLADLIKVGNFTGQVEWKNFLALATSALGDVNMLQFFNTSYNCICICICEVV